MTDTAKPKAVALRAEDLLPDHIDRAEINGVNVRKGTIGAFLQNAMRWSDPATSDADRDALATEIASSVPALTAIGVFTVLEVRDERLRALISC